MKTNLELKDPAQRDLASALLSGFAGGMGYASYKALIRHHVEHKTSSGHHVPASYAEYTALNEQRMKRLEKTAQVGELLADLIMRLDEPQHWLILTETWCGDAAQNIPYFEKAASLNERISTRYLLRDDHPEIMQAFLTDNGQSIPKLIAVDTEGNVLFDWGPRPAELQSMVKTYRNTPDPKEPYSEFQKQVQLWYLNNKGQMLQQELVNLISGKG